MTKLSRNISRDGTYSPAMFATPTSRQKFADALIARDQAVFSNNRPRSTSSLFGRSSPRLFSGNSFRSDSLNLNMIGGMPAEEYKEKLRRDAAERVARGGPFLLGPAAFRNYAEFDAARREAGYKPGVLAGPFDSMDRTADPRPPRPRSIVNDSSQRVFGQFSNEPELTERQQFNLNTFQRAAPGTRFAPRQSYSTSPFGITRNMPIPSSYLFGSQQ